MNRRKIKLFLKFHWIGVIIAVISIAIGISLVIFLRNVITAWNASESYFKRATLAQSGISFYIWIVVYIISMPLWGIMWIWIMRGGPQKFTQIGKKGSRRQKYQYTLAGCHRHGRGQRRSHGGSAFSY